MHHVALDRAGADDRHLDDQVVELLGPEPRQHVHLRPALHLEHADAVGAAEHGVGLRASRGTVCKVERRPAVPRDQREGAAEAGEHPEAQHVDLEDARARRCRPCPTRWCGGPPSRRCVTMASSVSGPRVMTKPPTWVARWRGKPMQLLGQLAGHAEAAVAGGFEALAPPPPPRATGRSAPQARLGQPAVMSSERPIALPTSRIALRSR